MNAGFVYKASLDEDMHLIRFQNKLKRCAFWQKSEKTNWITWHITNHLVICLFDSHVKVSFDRSAPFFDNVYCIPSWCQMRRNAENKAHQITIIRLQNSILMSWYYIKLLVYTIWRRLHTRHVPQAPNCLSPLTQLTKQRPALSWNLLVNLCQYQ